MSPARCALAAVLVIVLAACSSDPPAPARAIVPPSTLAPTPSVALPPAVAPPATAAPPSTAAGFRAEIVRIDAATAARMRSSWRPGCPVALEDLRLVRLVHRGFDGAVHDGELVVHHDVADGVVSAFRAMFEAGFPIERVRPVDEYGGDDGASMRDDNTSAFNCREVAGRPGVWSEHAYGRAIDVNPLRNPWVRGDVIDPPEGARYADRRLDEAGMLRPASAPVLAFRAIGWGWGGEWTGGQDWQHFSASGR